MTARRTTPAPRRGRRPNGDRARSPRLRNSPGQSDAQPDLRQVRVAVGHRLVAHLHQADHRHEHPQVPEPADQQIGIPPPRTPRRQRKWPPAPTTRAARLSRAAGCCPDGDRTRPAPPDRRTGPDRPRRKPGRWRSAARSGRRPAGQRLRPGPEASPRRKRPPAATSGIFSTTRRQRRADDAAAVVAADCDIAPAASSPTAASTKGSVTSIGLAISPRANSTTTAR